MKEPIDTDSSVVVAKGRKGQDWVEMGKDCGGMGPSVIVPTIKMTFKKMAIFQIKIFLTCLTVLKIN